MIDNWTSNDDSRNLKMKSSGCGLSEKKKFASQKRFPAVSGIDL